MKPADNPAVENLHQRTAQMLTAIDGTPIPQMDATFYQHYHEELRLMRVIGVKRGCLRGV